MRSGNHGGRVWSPETEGDGNMNHGSLDIALFLLLGSTERCFDAAFTVAKD